MSSWQLDPVPCEVGLLPHGTASSHRQQTSMAPTESSAEAALVITCSCPPQACLLWMPMTLKVSQSPSLHPTYARPLLLSQIHLCVLSLGR